MDSPDENISSALGEYLASTRHLEHWVLAGKRSGNSLRFPLGARPARIASLPDGRRARLRAIAGAYSRIKPHRVHAHSFGAGVYVRLALNIPTDSIVYSPHCYDFERQDRTAAARFLNAACEYLLAPRADAVAVSNPREGQLAARLHRTGKIIHVPHVPHISTLDAMDVPPFATTGPTAVAMGPLIPQRDPAFFARAVATARSDTTWIWIGDGEPRYRRLLEDAGVCVTGRLPRRNMTRLLQTADVYVHTAAWEGSYDTLLQAATADLPIVARSIPALEILRIPGLADTPETLADTVLRLLSSPVDRRIHHEGVRRAFRYHTRATQSARLREIYESAR
ncbi:glycosyltransferase family 4 protein [Streptomyces sp. S.PB5]|uniref:glycosyltransferase family 4 protein n=1 Tax=Streptomyces sp. S.PB5 TaxID=3020844 RepID=UPI0025B1F156|nr:glycosyltransferase family 4 protein [Streptomyces sp. S.PB5]MDN3026036.1 glycosyltransferase family 4 protein [Streptomyces sp. S.PB5]